MRLFLLLAVILAGIPVEDKLISAHTFLESLDLDFPFIIRDLLREERLLRDLIAGPDGEAAVLMGQRNRQFMFFHL